MCRPTACASGMASFAIMLAVLGCGEKPDPPKPKTKAQLVLDDRKMLLAGQEILMPCKLSGLEAILGKSTAQHDYRADKNEPAVVVHVWDDRGIYCFVRPDRSVVSQISFVLARRESTINPSPIDQFWPQQNYRGGIHLDRVEIRHDMTPTAVNEAQGRDDFVRNPRFPSRWTASYEGKSIALDTNTDGKAILEFSIGK